MTPAYFSDKFATALPYDRYVATGTDEQQRRWKAFSDVVRLTDAQRELIGGFVREMRGLVIRGIWCGDCVQQCPLLEHVAAANRGKVDLRFLDRDQNRDLTERFRINGGDRVPVALLMAKDFGLYSGRAIRSYRGS